jgi:hypothetical protein
LEKLFSTQALGHKYNWTHFPNMADLTARAKPMAKEPQAEKGEGGKEKRRRHLSSFSAGAPLSSGMARVVRPAMFSVGKCV